MKTFNEFQLDSQQLDEGLGTVAKVAIKGAVKFAKKGGLKKVGKKVGKLFTPMSNELNAPEPPKPEKLSKS